MSISRNFDHRNDLPTGNLLENLPFSDEILSIPSMYLHILLCHYYIVDDWVTIVVREAFNWVL